MLEEEEDFGFQGPERPCGRPSLIYFSAGRYGILEFLDMEGALYI